MSEENEYKPKWWYLIVILLFLALVPESLLSILTNYKHILINNLAFAETTPGVLLILCMLPMLILVPIFLFIHLIKPEYKSGSKVNKLSIICLVLCGIGLFSPILVGPLTSSYMTSQGYEKCNPQVSGLTSLYSQYWAKLEIGCKVWDLDKEARDILRKDLLSKGQEK